MFREKLRSFFEKTPVIHYIKQHETVVIGDIVVDVKNIILRPYACDGSHCLSMKSLPNHLEGYGFTFYNEMAAYGDCCRGPIVFISQAERQHIAEHLEKIIPHMSQEGQFIVKEHLHHRGPEHKQEAFAESARVTLGEQQGQDLDFAKMHTIWGDQCIFRTLHHDGQRGQVSTYTKIFLYPTLEFAQCRMLWDDDLLRHGARHKNGLRAASTETGVQRRCDSSKG